MALTAIEALREIQDQLAGLRADQIPDGWRTEADWSAEAGLTRGTVGKTLRDGVKAGIVERKAFRVRTDGGARSVFHYRTVDTPKQAKKK